MPNISKKELRLKEALAKVFRARSDIPGLEDLAHKLISGFGGLDKFVTEYVACFNSASPMVKTRLMEGMLKLMVLHEKTRPPRTDLSELDDETLKDLAVRLVSHVEEEEAERGPAGSVRSGAAGAGGDDLPGPGPQPPGNPP